MMTGEPVESEAVPIGKPVLLMVEGKDEELFFDALAGELELKNIQIVNYQGKTNLRRNLKAVTLSSGFADVASLGIMRDADADPDAAVQSIRDALRAADLPSPELPLESEGHDPKVAFMVLPDKDTAGALEDLCLRAVEDDPATDCVREYFECIRQRGIASPSHPSKAKVQAFLASRPEPGKRLGEAAQAGYWPWGNVAFQQVTDFLSQL